MKKCLIAILVAVTMLVNGCGNADVLAPSADADTESVSLAEAATTEEEPASKPEPEPVNPKDYTNIKDLFQTYGVKSGTCLSQKMIYDPKYSGLITEQFNSVTLENALKPEAILNQSASKKAGDIVVEFKSETTNLLDWAKKNNMSLRGHTLIWHSQTPEWIFHEEFNASKDLVSREVMLQRMESYISQVFSLLEEKGYLDMIYAYDVVNEAWEDNGTMRDSLWKQTIGDDYLYQAFYLADKYAPESVDLYYNDYNEQFKYNAVVDFVNSLKDESERSLIDGIGLQAHLYTKDDLNLYFKAVDEYAKCGLKVSLTELDVALGSYQNKLPAEEENLKAQGDFYYDLINGLLSRKEAGSLDLDGITFWGFADNLSWRYEQYPLLFDKDLNPKYAFYGVMQDKADEECKIDGNLENVVYQEFFANGIPQSDDDKIYLFEAATYETGIGGSEPVMDVPKDYKISFTVPFEKRHLFTRFIPAVLSDGEYVPINDGLYISNPEALASNNSPYSEPESKKGLLLDANTLGSELLTDLNVKRVVFNIPISFILGESGNENIPTVYFDYNGQQYPFDGFMLAGFDYLFSYLTENGYHTTAIVLNDWNEDYPDIIHPLSRNKTGKSMYYAFNTEEESGVRLMEAVALFLAERYNGGEYGLIQDWVIGNEINQQKIWNYMNTDNPEFYTSSFEKSFRTFYNAIRSNYSNARVFFSIDHDWNDNYGNNGRFFNARDVLYDFNECAGKCGNYDWGVSIHPYPNPLPKVKFWQDEYEKTEEAPVLTPMNLATITKMMCKKEFLNPNGEVRNMGVTEVGFSSKASEELQAAAFAYSYYIIDDNEYIDSYLLNRQTDDSESLKSGLAIGIYNNDYTPKYIAKVFTNIDTEKGEEYILEMLEKIGFESLEEALRKAR